MKRDKLKPNHYNPNKVAKPELELLEISILSAGWIAPITANPDMEIIDGFHRWTVSGGKKLMEKFQGFVPVVITEPKDKEEQQMHTIRLNRARGTHGVEPMAKIIQDMVESGLDKDYIGKKLGMEQDEVLRLALRAGIPMTDLIKKHDYSKAWVSGE